jgi:hypothetical protein
MVISVLNANERVSVSVALLVKSGSPKAVPSPTPKKLELPTWKLAFEDHWDLGKRDE